MSLTLENAMRRPMASSLLLLLLASMYPSRMDHPTTTSSSSSIVRFDSNFCNWRGPDSLRFVVVQTGAMILTFL